MKMKQLFFEYSLCVNINWCKVYGLRYTVKTKKPDCISVNREPYTLHHLIKTFELEYSFTYE